MRNRLERNHVAANSQGAGDTPGPDDVRAALDRICASDVLSGSPQLVSFLRFVVELVLRGERERIKGYTIGVEALGRGERFDPQLDPIVRVEGTRLRRAMERYYAGAGAHDPVIIELRRGSYVPAFRRRAASAGRLARLSGFLRQHGRGWTPVVAAAIVACIAIGVVAFMLWRGGRVDTAGRASDAAIAASLRPGNGMPVLLLQALEVAGSPAPETISPGGLFEKMSDAFTRFDAINIISQSGDTASSPAPPPEQRIDYRLVGSVEFLTDHTTTVRFRLVDADDGTVAWAKSFERLASARDHSAVEDSIVLDMAATLLQPFGVIRSLERISRSGDPRYRCVIEASESLRSFDPAEYMRARACLEQLTVVDPGFATGLRYIAAIDLRDYQFGTGDGAGAALLDHALRTVRHAIELQPESSRGYHTLASIQFARGETAQAFASSDRAIALNKYDKAAMSDYGGRLISAGEIERGMAMLRSAESGPVRQSSHHFFLFLGNYLQGDLPAATSEAGQITNDDYPLAQVATALVAEANGDHAKARQTLSRLAAQHPAWRDNTVGELKKFFPAAAIVDRLARDIATVGFSG